MTGQTILTIMRNLRVQSIVYIYKKLKILRIKKREYRDGIKSKETRPGWGEVHNACVGIMEGF